MNFNLHTCIRKPLQETEIYINYCAFQSKELTQETTALKEYDFETQIFKAATAVMQVTRKCLFPNHFPQKKKVNFCIYNRLHTVNHKLILSRKLCLSQCHTGL